MATTRFCPILAAFLGKLALRIALEGLEILAERLLEKTAAADFLFRQGFDEFVPAELDGSTAK